ncbi:MAG: RNA pseudouridine synthase [Verrucomicrobia bacterium]|nr:RNA pseudouridine synthase [Verrucomicrobiota bacterium]
MSAAIKLSSPATREFWEIPVLFEDEHLLALDKPAGLMVPPDPDNVERPSLMKLLHEGIAAGKPWAQQRNLTYLNHAHRLDTEASGVLLLAKNKTVFMALADQFSAEKPLKRHIALVWGSPLDKNFEVDAKLSQHPLKPGQMCVDARTGKKSRTKFEVLEQFADWSLLNCSPFTDRNHQVRIHLKHAGFPVVADELYGGKKLWLSRLKRDYRLKPGRDERPLVNRAALHAEELSLTHPVTNETVTIKSERPKDLRVALKYLRLYATGASRGGLDDGDQFEG